MVAKCYHRFDISFIGNSESELSQIRNAQGDGQHQAYIASPETVMDSNWHMGSGATNHITANLNDLTIKDNYRGKEKLTVGNGQNLDIKHVFFIINKHKIYQGAKSHKAYREYT